MIRQIKQSKKKFILTKHFLTWGLFVFTLATLSTSFVALATLSLNDLQAAPDKPQANKFTINPLSKLIPPYSAKYEVFHKSDSVGTAIRELEYIDEENVDYRYNTSVKWFIFSQKRNESSKINTSNLSKLAPLSYLYTRTGTGSDKKYHWRFNASEGKGYDLGRDRIIPLDFSLSFQDKLSYHLQHRLNLINDATQPSYSYQVISTSGTIKEYTYVVDKEEELQLPFGTYKTIRLKREIKEKERITYAWFAPKLNYLMVKLQQIKEGSEQFEAQLTDLTLTTKNK